MLERRAASHRHERRVRLPCAVVVAVPRFAAERAFRFGSHVDPAPFQPRRCPPGRRIPFGDLAAGELDLHRSDGLPAGIEVQHGRLHAHGGRLPALGDSHVHEAGQVASLPERMPRNGPAVFADHRGERAPLVDDQALRGRLHSQPRGQQQRKAASDRDHDGPPDSKTPQPSRPLTTWRYLPTVI